MSGNAGRAAVGGCLGVVLGGILGGVIGFLIADSHHPQTIFDATRPFILLTGVALGAISGAAAGAAVAVRIGSSRSQGMPDTQGRQDHSDSRCPPRIPGNGDGPPEGAVGRAGSPQAAGVKAVQCPRLITPPAGERVARRQ